MNIRNYIIQLLRESKQVGTLYHSTSFYNLKHIINNNVLKTSGSLECLSLSRQPLINSGNKKLGIQSIDIVLILDGNKISNNYKLEPFSFFTSKRGNVHRDLQAPTMFQKRRNLLNKGTDYSKDTVDYIDEYEEIVCKDIKNIRSYIKGFIVNSNFNKNEFELFIKELYDLSLPIYITNNVKEYPNFLKGTFKKWTGKLNKI